MNLTKEPVEVVGIVHPLGAGSGRSGKETLWTLRFSFVAWRISDGPIEERRLIVMQPGFTDEQMRVASASINPYDILRVRLRFMDEQGDPRGIKAELVEMVGKDTSDDELATRVEQLHMPVTVDHPILGLFTLDRRLNWYAAAPDWNEQTIQLYISREGCEEEGTLFATAENLWKQQKKWHQRIRDFAVEKLLDLKNGNWLGEKEKEFTPSRFKARIKLESIHIRSGGEFEFAFADGNLFWGHSIGVSGTLAEGPKHAEI